MQQIIGKLRKNETADHSDFDGGEAESLDAAAVKETLIRADEILPCRVLTSNVEKMVWNQPASQKQVRARHTCRTLADEGETFTGFNMELGWVKQVRGLKFYL